MLYSVHLVALDSRNQICFLNRGICCVWQEQALGDFLWKERRKEGREEICFLSCLPIGYGILPTSLGERRSFSNKFMCKSSSFRKSHRRLPVLGVSTVMTRALKPRDSALWTTCLLSCRSDCTQSWNHLRPLGAVATMSSRVQLAQVLVMQQIPAAWAAAEQTAQLRLEGGQGSGPG